MEAKELRIGNYISAATDENGNPIICVVRQLKNRGVVWGSDNEGGNHTLYESAIGITLTPELLKKVGFKMMPNRFLATDVLKAGIRIGYYNGNNSECSLFQFGIEFPLAAGAVKWLHQLQNLYFSLAGKELELNL